MAKGKHRRLTDTEREYIDLVEDVESQQSLVKLYEDYLNDQKRALETAQQKLRDFEAQHPGERLLKPFIVPEPVKTTLNWTFTLGSPYTSDSTNAPLRFDDALSK